MGFMLLLLAIIFGIVFITWLSCSGDEATVRENMMGSVVAGTVVAAAIVSIILLASWSSYVGMQKHKASVEAHATAVKQYVKNANIDIGAGTTPADMGKLTDLESMGYQKELAYLIRDTRKTIISYNQIYAAKKAYYDNFMFGILIIKPGPEDKLLKMSDYL